MNQAKSFYVSTCFYCISIIIHKYNLLKLFIRDSSIVEQRYYGLLII